VIVHLRSRGSINVRFKRDRFETFTYCGSDRIEDLAWAIAAKEGMEPGRVQLFRETGHCPAEMLIRDLSSDSLTCTTDAVTVRFVCPGGVQELVLRPHATVQVTRATVAARIDVDPDDLEFLVNGERMPDTAVIAEREIAVEFITPLKFMCTGREYDIKVSRYLPVAKIKELLLAELEVDPPIELMHNDRPIADEVRLVDIGSFHCIVVAPQFSLDRVMSTNARARPSQGRQSAAPTGNVAFTGLPPSPNVQPALLPSCPIDTAQPPDVQQTTQLAADLLAGGFRASGCFHGHPTMDIKMCHSAQPKQPAASRPMLSCFQADSDDLQGPPPGRLASGGEGVPSSPPSYLRPFDPFPSPPTSGPLASAPLAGGSSAGQVLSSSPASELATSDLQPYRIALCLDVIPQISRFRLSPSATLGEIRPLVVEKWELGTLDVEFAVTDMITGDSHRVEDDVQVGAIDHEQQTLIVRPLGTVGEPPAGEEGDASPAGLSLTMATTSRRALLGDTRKNGAPLPPVEMTHILFKLPQQGDRTFSLAFPKGQTVKDARGRVAAEMGGQMADVTLLFSGKALRDTFVLERLRTGKLPIIVVLRDTADILLLTARAMRDRN
jgi:hypothetical protein